MARRISEVALSVVLVSVVLILLWPPGDTVWTWWAVLPESLRGDTPILGFLMVFGGVAGALVTAATTIRLLHFAIGAVVAYVVLMIGIEVVLSPESPVHWALYGVIAMAIVGGGAVGKRVTADETTSSGEKPV